MDKRGGGNFRIFCRKFSVSLPKTSVGQSFTVAIISVIEKVSIRGGISQFFVEVFVSLYRNLSLENNLVFRKKFFRKFSCIGGGRGITVLSKFFILQDRNEKLCKGTLLFQENFWYRKNCMEKGAYRNFQSKFLCLTVLKTFVSESYCF